LNVNGNPLGDAIVGVGLAEVLESGGGSDLVKLSLRGCGLGLQGITRLVQALEKRSLSYPFRSVSVDDIEGFDMNLLGPYQQN